MRSPGLFIALLLAGCNGRPAVYGKPLDLQGPLKVGETIVWVDGGRGLTFALDPAATPPSVTTLSAGHYATFVMPSPKRKELLVLTAGHEPTHKGEAAEAPSLVVLSADPGLKIARTYPLLASFDRLALSDDGNLAVAFYSGDPHDDGAFFRNPNELAVINLAAPPDADEMHPNPTPRTIRSLGAAPLGVFFSPPMAIPAGSQNLHTLAVVMAKNYITLVDAGHPERIEITVPLLPADSTETLIPVQIVFVPKTANAFVRAEGSSDVFALAFEPRPPMDGKQNDFIPRINQPSAGKIARDMILYEEGDRTLILTANDSHDVALIDSATSEFTLLPLGAPVDTILPIPDQHLAILFSRSSPQPFVHFLNLDNLSVNLERNLTRRSLATAAHDLVAIPGGQQVLVIHDDKRTVISILDLGPHRTDTPILGRVPLESYDFTGSSYLIGSAGNLNRLGILDLVSLNPYDFRLDYAPRRVLSVGGRVIIDHASPAGLVTILPDPRATRAEARVLWGFFLEGVLDQNLKD